MTFEWHPVSGMNLTKTGPISPPNLEKTAEKLQLHCKKLKHTNYRTIMFVYVYIYVCIYIYILHYDILMTSYVCMYIYIYHLITCVCGDLGDNVLNCHKCHNANIMFYFDLKWNMTLQCSLLVNEIYETFLNCSFSCHDISCETAKRSSSRHAHHACLLQGHLFSFPGPSLVSSGDAVTLWMRLTWSTDLMAFSSRISRLFCNIFTVVSKHVYSSHVASEDSL